jgi:23S rRNA (uracil1939-C5)-methyltransferase
MEPATDTPAEPGQSIELQVERTVAGGAGLARETGGRVVLVEGALPGERVVATITSSKPRMATARLLEVVAPAAGRIPAPCPELHAGCGGCDLQHAGPALQRQLKVGIVRDALARIGRFSEVRIGEGEHLPTEDFRTVLRCGVVDGRVALHRRRSSELHPLDLCMIAHPLVEEVVQHGRFPGAAEVTIRAGARTGERLVLVAPGSAAAAAEVPADVLVVPADAQEQARDGRPPWIHEVVARRRLRISAGSFFQARPDGAEALVRAVTRALDDVDPLIDRIADLYGGVGLFSACLGARGGVLVERSAASATDAEVNLAELGTTVVRGKVERWRPEPVDAVVADPARAGLGREGVRAVLATEAPRVALVSCDPASLARDARSLADAGYELRGVELVDLFPHTHHVEAVSSFARARG